MAVMSRYLHYPTQEQYAKLHKSTEAFKENAKRCDYPPCNASAADKNMTALYKCSRCGEGRYCCHVHGNLDWDRHKLLCDDIKLKVGLYFGIKSKCTRISYEGLSLDSPRFASLHLVVLRAQLHTKQ